MGLRLIILGWLSFSFLFMSCGYTLQGSKNRVLQREGIRTLFVAPVRNNTYKAGVEHIVYNEIVRSLGSRGQIRLVNSAESADAILESEVQSAAYAVSASASADRLFPGDRLDDIPIQNRTPDLLGQRNLYVATEYEAGLQASFALRRQRPMPGQRETIWSSSLSRAKRFPGTNQLGAFGNTSALINDSEFDRALRDLAEAMGGDLHGSMLSLF